jgi:hypothetical protein
VTLHVHNPIYEEVKVDFQVKFRNGVDAGLFKNKLNSEIKSLLAPWAFDCNNDINFGGRIHKSVILNHIEERPYVDFVTCFKMHHIAPQDPANNPTADIEEAIATTPISILGSSNEHIIDVLDPATEGCTCADNIIPTAQSISASQSCT